ncbi:adenylosuccinate lyase [Bryobacter aggregatus]|uniref:adenylosuccinate lyase n=1 Tax=Bryobacter aggregatus TaxID=360054 RepID=UPI0004E1F6EE|nr:adenylosuccinate lyase [Bryobacter aggregatus]
MIQRYTRPEMGAIWSEQNKYQSWLEVELAASEALAELGLVPQEAAASLRAHAGFDVARIAEIEREVKHDVIAFTTAVAERMKEKGEAEQSRWLHYGLTSNDVVDTAQALQIAQASKIIAAGLETVLEALKKRAFEHKDTIQIGRTHGVHAEPITFGLKLANFYDELRRNAARFAAAAEEIRVGKTSGAVGAFAHLTPESEERICARLGLKAAPVSSQVLSRDLHAHYISVLALICSTLDKIAIEVRHLQRTEVREAEEPFAPGQKGSSAMPHKKNPIVCEQISGLARVVRGNVQAAFENIALWHERDISHSSVERVILPDSTILTDYLLSKTAWLVNGLKVNEERMLANFNATLGIVFSGQLLLDLAEAGMLRETAYKLAQGHAMQCWDTGTDFRDAVRADADVAKYLSSAQLDHTFSAERQLQNVGKIFDRVFV